MKNLLLFFLLMITAPAFGQTVVSVPAPDSTVTYFVPVWVKDTVPAEICLVYTLDSVKVEVGGVRFMALPRTPENESGGLFIFENLMKSYRGRGREQ